MSSLEKDVVSNLKKLGITDKNIKFAPKDGARDSAGPFSGTLKEEKTTKTLRPLTARVIPTSSTKNGLKITGERK